MINPRISAVWRPQLWIVLHTWCTRECCNRLGPFSCTPRVQDLRTKAEVVHLTPGLLGLCVLFNSHAYDFFFETYD